MGLNRKARPTFVLPIRNPLYKYKDIDNLEGKWKITYHENINYKKAGMATLTSEKLALRTSNITKD